MCYSQTYTIVQKFRVRLRLLISFKKFVQEPKPLNSMYCLHVFAKCNFAFTLDIKKSEVCTFSMFKYILLILHL